MSVETTEELLELQKRMRQGSHEAYVLVTQAIHALVTAGASESHKALWFLECAETFLIAETEALDRMLASSDGEKLR